ncbi:hypothetical protein [Desulfonauticus submarinus]
MYVFQNYSDGVSVNGIDVKTGKFKRLKKWHYFTNKKSLCGKYTQVKNDNLLPMGMISTKEICSQCLKKFLKKFKEEV